MTATVGLSPPPILQFFNNSGQPNVGGSVLTQVGGVNYATYQDSAGATALPNPIPLNSRGEISNSSGVSCQLFLVSGVTYVFTFYDAAGNQIDQAQYMSGGTSLSALSAATGSSLVGFIQGGTGAVARTVQDKDREIISVTDFLSAGQKADVLARTYGVDVTAAFQSCLDYIATGGKIIVPRGGYLISATLFPQNGITIAGDNWGDGSSATLITFTGAAQPCFKVGTSDSVFNYGNAIRDLNIILTQQNSTGIKFNATVYAEAKNIAIEGQVANLATRSTIAFDLDGRNVSGFFNSLMNCRTSHVHTGFYSRTTGTTSVTQNMFWNCTAAGDMAAGDTTSQGMRFDNAGESSTIIGGDLEDCGSAFYNQGNQGTSVSAFGVRFEANMVDLQINSTDTAPLMIIGCPTLSAAKVNDNSGNKHHVIQAGVAGSFAFGTAKQYGATNGIVALPMKTGEVRINGGGDFDWTATISGPTAAGTLQVHTSVEGKRVTLTVPKFNNVGISSALPFTITGMPEELYPASDIIMSNLNVIDNGADVSGSARVRLLNAGGFTVFENSTGGNFTSSINNTGFYGFSLTYQSI